VAYKPAGIQVRQPNPAYQIVASEIVIVQQNGAGPYGDPEVQLAINPREIVAPGVPLFSYTASEPSRAVGAFLLAVGATGTPIKLVPISTAGLPLNDLATAAFWESGVPAYRLRAIMQPTPKPTVVSTPVPSPIAKQLVGQEWSILAQGDFNRDGRRDVVAYKPAKIAPRSIDPSMPLTVGALVIVQEGKGGQPELQLSISTTQVVVPGNRLVSYAVPPSGFQIGFVPGRTGALIFVALNSAGEPIGLPSLIEWNPSSQLFQL
jgi:hypothetical protein